MSRPCVRRLRHWTALAGAVAVVAGSGGAEAKPAPRELLLVAKAGSGAVRDGSGAVECGKRCRAHFRRGALVTLTARPARHFDFVRWGGACIGLAPSCVVAMDGRRAVRAEFRRREVSLALTVGGPGTVASEPPGLLCGVRGDTCSASFGEGTRVFLRAEPAPGHEPADWAGACAQSGLPTCTLRPTEALEATATFRAAPRGTGSARLTVTRSSRSGERIVSDPPGIECLPTCAGEFAAGTLVTLAPVRYGAYWRGACVGIVPRCRLVVDAPLAVTAILVGGPHPAPPSYGVNVTVSGPGTVTDGRSIRCGRAARSLRDCRRFVSAGAVVVLRAVPEPETRFVAWGGFCRGRGPCSLTVASTMFVTAAFRGD